MNANTSQRQKVITQKRQATSTTVENDDSISKYREYLKLEKSVDQETHMKNLEKISDCRFYSAILSGILCGTLCLTGIDGIAFYLINFFLFSIILSSSLQFQSTNYFVNKSTILTNGLSANIMVFVIFWVMFYNLVHIY